MVGYYVIEFSVSANNVSADAVPLKVLCTVYCMYDVVVVVEILSFA